ncbi:MAG: PAS domain S-box protein [Luteibaculaceae bacterium]
MLKPLDLDECKRLKQAVLSAPNNYKDIVENTHLAVVVTDVTGKVAYVNKNYTGYTGYSLPEIAGQHFRMLVPPDQQEKLEELHDRFFERQFQMLRFWQTKVKAGQQVNIQADSQLIELADGTPHKVMFIQPEI